MQTVTVNDTFWHGITISALSGESFGNPTGLGLNVTMNPNLANSSGISPGVSVNFVGPAGSQDANRIGILLQNTDKGVVDGALVYGEGVGIETNAFGPGAFGQSTGARNHGGVEYSTVTDAVVAGYSFNYADGLGNASPGFTGFATDLATFTNPANTAIGIYLNHSETQLMEDTVNGAHIGVKVQNTSTVADAGSNGDQSVPDLSIGLVLTGPGTAVAGSVGILVQNSLDQPNSASVYLTDLQSVTGYQTGMLASQVVAPADGLPNTVILDRGNISGNATGYNFGAGTVVEGATNTTDPVITNGATLKPGYIADQVQSAGTIRQCRGHAGIAHDRRHAPHADRNGAGAALDRYDRLRQFDALVDVGFECKPRFDRHDAGLSDVQHFVFVSQRQAVDPGWPITFPRVPSWGFFKA